VTRTFEPVFFPRIKDRTRKVRAFLTVSDVGVLIRPDQNAGVSFRGIAKQPHAAHGNIARTTNTSLGIHRRFPEEGTSQNPQVAREHAQARQHQKLRKLPAADVSLVGGVNGKLVLPERLVAGASE
jgi:hypothetical protein